MQQVVAQTTHKTAGKRKDGGRLAELYKNCDDRFAFIAGYTDGGAPYGVMWEEVGIDPGLPVRGKSEALSHADVRLIIVQTVSAQFATKEEPDYKYWFYIHVHKKDQERAEYWVRRTP